MQTVDLLYYELITTSNQILVYAQKVGSVNYTAISIKLDIFFICSKLLYYLKNLLLQYQKTVKRVLQYFQEIKNLVLEFSDISFNINIFLVYSDTVFVDIIDSRKSSVGYVFQLYDRLIAWKASKQLTITTSSIEAELLALTDAGKEMIV